MHSISVKSSFLIDIVKGQLYREPNHLISYCLKRVTFSLVRYGLHINALVIKLHAYIPTSICFVSWSSSACNKRIGKGSITQHST
ncbi:hypothetical protein VNO77_04872 [Canavalia gladiata]|uniref:Uncharacterized protein n=1 Tax=Canavalia gladiata TaxID=3824 RepID=A0AAN9R849_CANGL